MTAKLDYRWQLREVMATQGMFHTATLRPLLIERGVTLSPSQVYRLVTEKPERLSMPILMALLDILGCRMDELIEPIAKAAPARKAAAAAAADSGKPVDPDLGALRPKRARIVPGNHS